MQSCTRRLVIINTVQRNEHSFVHASFVRCFIPFVFSHCSQPDAISSCTHSFILILCSLRVFPMFSVVAVRFLVWSSLVFYVFIFPNLLIGFSSTFFCILVVLTLWSHFSQLLGLCLSEKTFSVLSLAPMLFVFSLFDSFAKFFCGLPVVSAPLSLNAPLLSPLLIKHTQSLFFRNLSSLILFMVTISVSLASCFESLPH